MKTRELIEILEKNGINYDMNYKYIRISTNENNKYDCKFWCYAKEDVATIYSNDKNKSKYKIQDFLSNLFEFVGRSEVDELKLRIIELEEEINRLNGGSYDVITSNSSVK